MAASTKRQIADSPADVAAGASLAAWGSPAAVVVVGPSGEIAGWNRGAELLLGYTAEEIMGRPSASVFESDADVPSLCAGFLPAEVVCVRKDGSRTELTVSASPVPCRDGLSQSTCLIGQPISRRRAESVRELRRFREALDAHAIVAVTDARGVITEANDSFCRISKYSREELIGTTHRLIKSGYHPPAFFDEMWATIAAGRIWKGRIRNRAKDGSFYWVETTIVPFLDHRGQPERYVALRTEVTEPMGMLEQLRAREAELTRSNQALEEFTSVAAHDLQEPLRGVSTCVQILRSRFGHLLDAEGQEYIHHAVANADRARGLIQGLLDYARLDRDRVVQVVDCDQVLEAVRENLSQTCRESRATIEAAKLGSVAGDPVQILQLFQNLIGNALKFRADAPPRVSVQARFSADGMREFEVADNGIGIDPEHADLVFRMFQRLHPAAKYPGAGMGLALCRRIVECHGGRIWIRSRPGQGASIYFTLPPPGRRDPPTPEVDRPCTDTPLPNPS